MNEPFLGTTPVHINDAEQFFELSNDTDIRTEFVNMRFNNVDEARGYLQYQINVTENSEKNFFKATRIIFDGNAKVYTEANSLFIGFISLHDTGLMDSMLTGGFQQNLSYAIKSSFRGKGLMTIALNMTLEAMREDGYNFVPALVKTNNIASEKVLRKCSFDKVRETSVGSTYVRRLTMNEYEYKKIFGL